ncbi:MAG: hypothetical protein M3540_12275 [Actinomycetota bacterium]|nr:hypothetical protein [Actinomycetota bacterium]
MKLASPLATAARKDLLDRCKRDHVPIRRAFVQHTAQGGGPGPLADLVRNRREVALDLYLLLHASACGGAFDTRLHALVWARALGLDETRHSASLISRNWTWLESERLIAKARDRRLLNVTLLKEDGSGTPYSHPGKAGNYFKLSHRYWTDEWCDRLDVPAKAALLILLSRQPGNDLPQERASKWYGISSDTLGRGLKTLRENGLVRVRVRQKQAPLSPIGFSWEQRYTLLAPFNRPTPKSRGATGRKRSATSGRKRVA